MLIQLTGVVQDGTSYTPGVPTNNRTTLTFPRGSYVKVRMTVVNPANVPFNVSYWTAVLTVKRAPDEPVAFLSSAGVPTPEYGPNVVEFTILPGETASPAFLRRAVYDIWLINGDDHIQAMPASPFILEPTVRSVTAPLPPPPPAVQAEAGTVPVEGGPYYTILRGTPVAAVDGVLVPADAGDPLKMPCIGLYTGSANNRVRTDGEETGLSGLPENTALYIAVGGGLTAVAPSEPGQTSQRIGESLGTTTVFVQPEAVIRF